VKTIYNPTTEDFTTKYDGKPYTIKSLDMKEFPDHIADHLTTHLANRILHSRKTVGTVEADLENIKKDIKVKI
jgi:hypothetical protein